jgi:hypothetical protein
VLYTSGLVCQQVLQESDATPQSSGVLSAIRIIDRVIVDVPATLPGGVAYFLAPAHCVALVIFKSDTPEQFDAIIALHDPGGTLRISTNYACLTGGGVSGHALKLDLLLDSNSPGLWRVDVTVRGQLALRIPIEVIYNRAVQA